MTRRARLACLPGLCLALLSGCAAHRRSVAEPDLRPIVTRVKIRDARERDPDAPKGGPGSARALRPAQIRAQLAQGETHFLHWIPILNFVYPEVHLEGTAWEADQVRIANIYAQSGFFDARVVASQTIVRKLRRDGVTPRFVWIVHDVHRGLPSQVRDVTVHLDMNGIEDELSPLEQEELRRQLQAQLPCREGERFSMDRVEASRRLIRARLEERARPRAQAVARVDAYPEEQAVDVHFEVVPGRKAVFGDVRIHGSRDVAERYVLRHVHIEKGKPWDSRQVQQTQQAIYDMGVFSLVTVGPDLDGKAETLADGTQVVPVDVFLKERKPRVFEGGGGLGFTSGSFDVHGKAAFSHVNLFHRLVRFDLDVEGGFVYLGPEDLGPGGHMTASLRVPNWPHRTLGLFLSGGFETDVRRGYKYYSPDGQAGVVWSPVRGFRGTLSYGVSYFGLYENRLDALGFASVAESEGIALDDGYFLAVLRQEVVIDLRDNLLAPNRGLFGSVAVDEALPPGGFRYVKVIGDLRGYVPLGTPRLVLASRALGSYIHTWGDQDQVPIQEAIFAGGDGTVRGWKPRYLGPRTVEEDCERRDCIIPLGGKVGFAGSVELRGRLVDGLGLWLAGFADLGRVWADAGEIGSAETFFSDLQVSLGGGVRYDLSIGRVRLDFAVHPRAWTDDYFRQRLIKPRSCETLATCPEDERLEPAAWSVHFGIGESF